MSVASPQEDDLAYPFQVRRPTPVPAHGASGRRRPRRALCSHHRARRHPDRPCRPHRMAAPAPRPERLPGGSRSSGPRSRTRSGHACLRLLAWLAWAYFVFSVAAGLVVQLRGRRPGHHFRLFGSSTTAALIAAVLILGQLRGAHTTRTGPPAKPVPVVRLLAQTTSAVIPSAPMSAAQPATVTHTVVPGDTLWSIAVQYYGDGTQWQAIYQANVGLPQPGGGALTDAHWIYPGWSLVIPGATQSSPTVPATPAPAPASIGPVPPLRPPKRPRHSPTTSALSRPDHHSVSHGGPVGRPMVPRLNESEGAAPPVGRIRTIPITQSAIVAHQFDLHWPSTIPRARPPHHSDRSTRRPQDPASRSAYSRRRHRTDRHRRRPLRARCHRPGHRPGPSAASTDRAALLRPAHPPAGTEEPARRSRAAAPPLRPGRPGVLARPPGRDACPSLTRSRCGSTGSDGRRAR